MRTISYVPVPFLLAQVGLGLDGEALLRNFAMVMVALAGTVCSLVAVILAYGEPRSRAAPCFGAVGVLLGVGVLVHWLGTGRVPSSDRIPFIAASAGALLGVWSIVKARLR